MIIRYGFNAGSQLSVDGVTALAFFNTDMSASSAAITWLILDWSLTKKPKFLGLLTGIYSIYLSMYYQSIST